MMKRIIIFILSSMLLIAGVTFFIVSCASEACFDETDAFLKASVYDNSTKKVLTIDSLTLYGTGDVSDTIYDKASSVKPILFPLDPADETCTLVIRINKGLPDTITFRYSSYPHLISKECGYTIYYDLDTILYTQHSIDAIMTEKKNITTVNEENIRIYY